MKGIAHAPNRTSPGNRSNQRRARRLGPRRRVECGSGRDVIGDQHAVRATGERIGAAHLAAAVNAALHGASVTTIAAIMRPASHGAGYGPWNDLAERVSVNATPELARDLAHLYSTLVHTPTENGTHELARYHCAERHLRELRATLFAPASTKTTSNAPWIQLTGGPAWVLALIGNVPIVALRAPADSTMSAVDVQVCGRSGSPPRFDERVRHIPPGSPLPAPARSLLDRVGTEPLTERAHRQPIAALQVDSYDLAIIEHLTDHVRIAIYDQEPTQPFLRAEHYIEAITERTPRWCPDPVPFGPSR